MRRYSLAVCLTCASLLIISCQSNKSHNHNNDALVEITATEKAFEQMAAEKGIAEAFWYYADSGAVIKRGRDSIIHGKEGIRNYYSTDYYKSAKVTWSPDFIGTSSAGDMGYTYGKYSWKAPDSTGTIIESKGIFHTVWKKQSDGSWKYVWD